MKKIFTLLFVMSTIAAMAQIDYGQNPTDLNWQILKSPHANVIFLKGMEAQARRTASIINYMDGAYNVSIGPNRKFLNLVIQSETTIPNGYVSLAPFRSEFYATPPSDMNLLGSTDWLDLLSIHEYRHAIQFSNGLYGFTKLMYFAQGQIGWATSQILTFPNWFFEGDAVWAETNFTNAGRGRMPSFTNFQRALAQNGPDWKYMKWRNGSYKDLVPDHYVLGYTMLSYLRNEQGQNVLAPVIRRASAAGPFFWSFSRWLKVETGYSTKALYQDSWANAKNDWANTRDTLDLTPTIGLTDTRLRTPTFYHYPQENANGDVVVLKKSFKNTDRIVEIKEDGSEELIASPGVNLFTRFDVKGSAYVWTALSQNARRNNRNYSNIVYLPSKDAKKIHLTKGGKYFSPVFNQDVTKIYAHYRGADQVSSIKSIDISNKEIDTIIEFDPSEFVGRIDLTEDDHILVYIVKTDSRLAIWKLDLITSEKTQVTPWTAHIVDAIRVYKNAVYYTASFSGIDNIYRTPLDGSMRIEQLTNVPIGAYDPDVSADGKTLYFTETIFQGHQVSLLNISPDFDGHIPHFAEPKDMTFQDTTNAVIVAESLLETVVDENYEISDYRKSPFRALKLHSWAINPSPVEPSLSIDIDNFLRDFSASLGVGYNINEKGVFYSGEINFHQLYPVISLIAEQSQRQADFLDKKGNLIDQNFNQASFGVGLSVPLNWVCGNYYASLKPLIAAQYHLVGNVEMDNNTTLPDATFSSLNTGVTASYKRRTATQNLYSKWGIDHSTSLFSSLNSGEVGKFITSSTVYLPGLASNHSLRFTGAFQKELLSNPFQTQDNFFYARGFDTPINDEYLKYAIDYSLPLLYPDKGFWGTAYLKRISANLFFDYGQSNFSQAKMTTTFKSTGLELLFDLQLINLVPLQLGARGTYLITNDPQNPNVHFTPSLFIGMNL